MGFFSKLSEIFSEEEKNQSQVMENLSDAEDESEDISITLASEFVAEIEKYYINDILKQKSDYITLTNVSESQLRFLKKKIAQEEEAKEELLKLKNRLFEIERELNTVWGKSSYSFYHELEETKTKQVYEKLYQTVINLTAINTKEELDTIIQKRLKDLKAKWNITQEIPFPKNYKLKIVSCEDGFETYQFGSFSKKVVELPALLLPIYQEMISKLCVEIGEPFSTREILWIRLFPLSRLDLDFMRKTKLFENTWEYHSKFVFDKVSLKDLEQYIKGTLSLLYQTNAEYIICQVIEPFQTHIVKEGETRVEIIRPEEFIWQERNGAISQAVAIIKKRSYVQKLTFV